MAKTQAASVQSKASAEEAPPAIKREYAGDRELDHDLFKLEPATLVKDVSYTDVPVFERFEHTHLFHTIDSDGRKLSQCTPAGGHVHELEQLTVDDSGRPVAIFGPPMKLTTKRRGRKWIRELVPIEFPLEHQDPAQAVKGDFHTHVVTYKLSQKIKPRLANAEAAKFVAAQTALRRPVIPNVQEG